MKRVLDMEKRRLELGVGIFLIIGLACLAYLSFKLGDVRLFGGSDYAVYAKFSSVAGLKDRATVMQAGVPIGQVRSITLENGQALVRLEINRQVRLEEDVIASIRTMGILGDKYVSLSPGASEEYLGPGDFIMQTEPPLDIEGLLGRFVFGGIDDGGDDWGL